MINFTFGALREADVPAIVPAAIALKKAIADFFDACAQTKSLDYPVASTMLVSVPSMLDDILEQYDPGNEVANPLGLGESRGHLGFVALRCFE